MTDKFKFVETTDVKFYPEESKSEEAGFYGDLPEGWNKPRICDNENCGIKGNCMYTETCRKNVTSVSQETFTQYDPFKRLVFPKMIDDKESNRTAYITIGTSLAFTIITAIVIIVTLLLAPG